MTIENFPNNLPNEDLPDTEERKAISEMSEEELEQELQSAVGNFKEIRRDIRELASGLEWGDEIEELAGELTPEQKAELEELQKSVDRFAGKSISEGIRWAIPALIAMSSSLENSEVHGALIFAGTVGAFQSGYPALKAAWRNIKKSQKKKRYKKRKETERVKNEKVEQKTQGEDN